MIGTPAYNCQVHTAFVGSLLAFQQAHIPFSLVTIGNESLITRARNSILSYFHFSKQYTHLLFLDGDIGLTAEGLGKLLAHDRDVIGAQVPLKSVRENGERLYNVGVRLDTEGLLAKVDYLGTAVMILSRSAVDSLVEDARANNRIYRVPEGAFERSAGIRAG